MMSTGLNGPGMLRLANRVRCWRLLSRCLAVQVYTLQTTETTTLLSSLYDVHACVSPYKNAACRCPPWNTRSSRSSSSWGTTLWSPTWTWSICKTLLTTYTGRRVRATFLILFMSVYELQHVDYCSCRLPRPWVFAASIYLSVCT